MNFLSNKFKSFKLDYIVLLSSNSIFILSLIPVLLIKKRGLADGYHSELVWNDILKQGGSLFDHSLNIAPSYFPELTYHFISTFFLGETSLKIKFFFTNLLLILSLIYACRIVIRHLAKNSINTITTWSYPLFLASLYNLSIFFHESLLWHDATNAHIGSYLATILIFIYFTIKKDSHFLMILITLSLFSNKLLIITGVLPAFFLIESRKEVFKFIFLIALSTISLLYEFIPTHPMSVANRLILSMDKAYLSYETFIKNFHFYFKYMDSIKILITMSLLFGVFQFFKSKRVFIYFSVVLLSGLFFSILTGNFRDIYSFRYIGSGLILFHLLITQSRTATNIFILTGSLLILPMCFSSLKKTLKDYPLTKIFREQKLAMCIQNLTKKYNLTKGIAGHWDADPVNMFLNKKKLYKFTLRDNDIKPYLHMTNVYKNTKNDTFNFAVSTPESGFYLFNDQRLRRIGKVVRVLNCKNTNANIYIYDKEDFSSMINSNLSKYKRD